MAEQGELQVIDDNAFEMCGISSFMVTANVSDIGDSVFCGDTLMTSIKVVDSNVHYKIVNEALYNIEGTILEYYPTGKTGSYTVASGTEEIAKAAFAYSAITGVKFNNSINKIGISSFTFSQLTEVSLPNTIVQLDTRSFADCHNLKCVFFEEECKLEEIPDAAFSRCYVLSEISIPNSVKIIDKYAFMYSGLEHIHFGKDSELTAIGEFAFSSTKLKNINVPAGVCEIRKYAFGSCYEDVYLENIEFTKESKLVNICEYAFCNCTLLDSITIPDATQIIGEQAFYNTGLKTVDIGVGLTNIGPGAFSACQQLENINVDSGNDTYASYEGVLYNKEMSHLMMYPASRIGEYSIPATTQYIDAYAFANAYKLSGIHMNQGLLSIGGYAFSCCSGIPTPELPSTLETIGYNAFEYCESMTTKVIIPKSVISVGRYAYYYDYNIKEIEIEADSAMSRLGYGAFGYTGISSFTIPENVSSMGQEVFTGSKDLVTVTFEADSKLDYLAAWTFNGIDSLRQITFEEGSQLLKIEARACEGLVRLNNVDLSNCLSLTKIDNYAFMRCTSLSEVKLPEGLKEIGRYAFSGCLVMKKVTIPKDVEYIGRYAFNNTDSADIYFRSSVLPTGLEDNWDAGIGGYYVSVSDIVTSGDWTYALTSDGRASIISYNGSDSNVLLDKIDGHEVISIGGNAFRDNVSLATIALPATLQGIYQGAFEGTSSLQEISIPENVSVIDSRAFYKSGISSVTFEGTSKLEVIGRYAFAETTNLEAVSIPDGLTEIRDYTFYKSGVKSVIFGEATRVTKIGKFAFSKSRLIDIDLPDKLTIIDDSAFRDIDSLEDVEFGEGAKLTLSSNAFNGSGLKSVDIPSNVAVIEEFCFVACDELMPINVAEENEKYSSVDGVLCDKAATRLITCPAGKTGDYDVPVTVTKFGFAAFEGSKLSNISIPTECHLNTIGYRAFYNCTNLESIDIPDSVQSVEYYAFANCSSLATVNIGENSQLGGIYRGAFYNCEKLSEIVIPDSVQEIEQYAFYGCGSLSNVTLSVNSKLKEVYAHAFEYSGITEFTMPEEVEAIGDYAFNGAKLSKLTMNESVQYIGKYAFADCGLKYTKVLTIPVTVEYLGESALKGATETEELTIPFFGEFEGDESYHAMARLFGVSRGMNIDASLKIVRVLTGDIVPCDALFEWRSVEEVYLPDTIHTIQYGAISWCGIRMFSVPENVTKLENCVLERNRYLSKVELGSKLESIGDSTFCQDMLLSDINLPESLKNIGYYAFQETNIAGEMKIGKNLSYIGEGAFSAMANLESIAVDENNKYYSSQDGILYDKQKSELISVPGKISGEITMPDSVLKIDSNSFSSCKYITEINLPSCLSEIGQYAFQYCSGLESVNIPDSVTKLGGGTFAQCVNITEAYLGNGINEIPEQLFYNCNKMVKVNIPNSVEYIEGYSFIECLSLRYIYIPESVRFISGRAFYGCNNMECIDVSENNINYKSVDGIIYNHKCDEIVVVPKAINGTVNIPDSVTKLADGSFTSCINLEGVVVPDSVNTIGTECFRNCISLHNISIGRNITNIALYAFDGTGYYNDESNWEDGVLYLGEYVLSTKEQGRPDVVTIREGTRLIAEEGMTGNGMINSLKGVILPDTIKYINKDAFWMNTKMRFIRLGNGEINISEGAFSDCGELRSLYTNKKVNLNSSFGYCDNLKVLKSDGTLNVADIVCSPDTISVVYSEIQLDTILQCGVNMPSDIIITSTGKMDENFLSGLDDSDSTIYCYVDKDIWPEGWNHGQKVYYKGDWNLSTFYLNDMIVDMKPVKKGETVQSPATSLISEYLYDGAIFKGWDINGDGQPDSIPATLTEDLEAKAIIDIPVSSISMSESKQLEVSRSCKLVYTCLPKANTHSGEVTWSSSDDSIATVDSNGMVTAVAEGTTSITATSKEAAGISAVCTVTVVPLEYGIKLDVTGGTANVGEVFSITPDFAFAEDDNDTTVWSSSDDNIAAVDQSGAVTAAAPGNATIHISHGDYSAEYVLEVKLPLEGILVKDTENGIERELNVDDTCTLSVTYLPMNTTDCRDANWYSQNIKVAKVNDAGVVTAMGPGTTNIVALVGNKTSTYKVTVKSPLKWIKLNTTTGTMRIDRKKPLNVIYEPVDTTDDTSVTWSTSNAEVASVNDSGIVTANKTGKAVITGKVGCFEATYSVTVIGLKDSSTGIIVTNSDDSEMKDTVALNVDTINTEQADTLYSEQLGQIEDQLSDNDGHKPEFMIYDISLDESGMVVQPETTVDVDIPLPDGLTSKDAAVYRLEPEGTLTNMGAEYNEGLCSFATEHFSIYVLASKTEKVYATDISLNKGELSITEGAVSTLSVVTVPSVTNNEAFTWTSSDSTIVSVDSKGNIQGLKAGTADVSVRTTDGYILEKKCRVTVGHDWNEGEVTKEPTCTEKGSKLYTCKTCQTTKTEDIEALGHEFSPEWTVDKAATCTEAGSKSHHCIHEGCLEVIDATVIPATGHTWDAGVVVKQPTSTEQGIMRFTCSQCGAIRDEAILTLQIKNISVTYQMDGGTNNTTNPLWINMLSQITLQNPTKSGCAFDGWFTDTQYSSPITTISNYTADTLTLYAKWTKLSVKKPAIKSIKRLSAKKIKLSYKAIVGVKGYEIEYATNQTFKNSKKSMVQNLNKTFSLKRKRTYYFRMRAYVYDSEGQKVYSKYSSKKKVVMK